MQWTVSALRPDKQSSRRGRQSQSCLVIVACTRRDGWSCVTSLCDFKNKFYLMNSHICSPRTQVSAARVDCTIKSRSLKLPLNSRWPDNLSKKRGLLTWPRVHFNEHGWRADYQYQYVGDTQIYQENISRIPHVFCLQDNNWDLSVCFFFCIVCCSTVFRASSSAATGFVRMRRCANEWEMEEKE